LTLHAAAANFRSRDYVTSSDDVKVLAAALLAPRPSVGSQTPVRQALRTKSRVATSLQKGAPLSAADAEARYAKISLGRRSSLRMQEEEDLEASSITIRGLPDNATAENVEAFLGDYASQLAQKNPILFEDRKMKKGEKKDLNSLTVNALKEKLRALGLKVSGVKAELVARLEEHEKSQQSGGTEDEDIEGSDADVDDGKVDPDGRISGRACVVQFTSPAYAKMAVMDLNSQSMGDSELEVFMSSEQPPESMEDDDYDDDEYDDDETIEVKRGKRERFTRKVFETERQLLDGEAKTTQIGDRVKQSEDQWSETLKETFDKWKHVKKSWIGKGTVVDTESSLAGEQLIVGFEGKRGTRRVNADEVEVIEDDFRIADRVEVRGQWTSLWETGIVTNVRPLLVQPDGWKNSYQWPEVRPLYQDDDSGSGQRKRYPDPEREKRFNMNPTQRVLVAEEQLLARGSSAVGEAPLKLQGPLLQKLEEAGAEADVKALPKDRVRRYRKERRERSEDDDADSSLPRFSTAREDAEFLQAIGFERTIYDQHGNRLDSLSKDEDPQSAVLLQRVPASATLLDIQEFLGEHAAHLAKNGNAIRIAQLRRGWRSGDVRLQFSDPSHAKKCAEELYLRRLGTKEIKAYFPFNASQLLEPSVPVWEDDAQFTDRFIAWSDKKPEAEDLRGQVLYYLSDENLRRDKFFHDIITQTDGGWISADVFMGCPRVQKMGATPRAIIQALRLPDMAPGIEVNVAFGQEAVRRLTPPPPLDEDYANDMQLRLKRKKAESKKMKQEEERRKDAPIPPPLSWTALHKLRSERQREYTMEDEFNREVELLKKLEKERKEGTKVSNTPDVEREQEDTAREQERYDVSRFDKADKAAIIKRMEKIYASSVEKNAFDKLRHIAFELGHKMEDVKTEEVLDRLLVKTAEKMFGPHDKETMIRKSLHAHSLTNLGELEEAEKLAREVLDFSIRVYGKSDRESLKSLERLAMIHQKQSKLEEARTLQSEALEIARGRRWRTKLLPLLQNLAKTQTLIGNLTAAEELLREELALTIDRYGPYADETLNVMTRLAKNLISAGQFTESRKITRRLASVTKHLYSALTTSGEAHSTRINETRFYGAERARAVALIRDERRLIETLEALDAMTEKQGLQSTYALGVMNRYAAFLQNMGDCKKAELQLEQILEVRLERRMDNSDTTRGIVHRLALVQEKRGDFEKASSILQLVVQQNLRSLGGNHSFTVQSMWNLARTLDRKGEHQAAETLLLWVVPRLRERAEYLRASKKRKWKVFRYTFQTANHKQRQKTKAHGAANGIDNLNEAEKLLMRVKYRQGKIDSAKTFASEAYGFWNSVYGPLHKYTFAIEAVMDEIEDARKLLSKSERLREALSECESISGFKIDRDRLATFGSIGSKMILNALDIEKVPEKLPALAS